MGASSFPPHTCAVRSALSAYEESSDQRFLHRRHCRRPRNLGVFVFWLEFAVLNLASPCRAARIHPETSPSGWGFIFCVDEALCDQIRNQGRSEERRVGKECRCGWTTVDLEK